MLSSPSRVIAVVNQGSNYSGDADAHGSRAGHFWMEELSRSLPNSPRLLLKTIGTTRAVVSMTSAADARVELGVDVPALPDGWFGWISDVIRIERLSI